MKPTELRIGNLIYNCIGEPFKVNATTIGSFGLGVITLGNFKPIPLTEDWLERFGFVKMTTTTTSFDDEYIDGTDRYRTRHPTWALTSEKKLVALMRGFRIANELQFVHQWQNLYYALTGIEITIEL